MVSLLELVCMLLGGGFFLKKKGKPQFVGHMFGVCTYFSGLTGGNAAHSMFVFLVCVVGGGGGKGSPIFSDDLKSSEPDTKPGI